MSRISVVIKSKTNIN